jgi:hypothetical protein
MSAVPEHDVVPFEKPPSHPPRPTRMRAADTDRQATVHVLQDALARGQLTFEEAAERMTAAWDTRYLADLAPLTADLPRAPEAAPATPGWTALAQLALAQLRVSLATAFPGGARSARARLAIAVTLLGLLAFVLLAGAAAHALFDGGGPGFGPGDFHPRPHPPFGGP